MARSRQRRLSQSSRAATTIWWLAIPCAAVAHYRAAVQLNPHSARYWFDLASAYQVLGDTANQTAALERAIQADSMTPDVAWEAANLYLVQGENEKALREFRVVLASDPSLAAAAIQFCWRINPMSDASPARRQSRVRTDAYLAFLTLLETQTGDCRLRQSLERIDADSSCRSNVRYAYEYFHFLIQHKEVDQAALVWQQTANRFGYSSYLPSPGNLDREWHFQSSTSLNAGFDWQYQKQTGVKLTLDPSDFHAGRRSLLITFDGPGISDAGIYQYVVCATKYDLRFFRLLQERRHRGRWWPSFHNSGHVHAGGLLTRVMN